jgi:hypothetical protein
MLYALFITKIFYALFKMLKVSSQIIKEHNLRKVQFFGKPIIQFIVTARMGVVSVRTQSQHVKRWELQKQNTQTSRILSHPISTCMCYDILNFNKLTWKTTNLKSTPFRFVFLIWKFDEKWGNISDEFVNAVIRNWTTVKHISNNLRDLIVIIFLHCFV